MNPRPSVQRLSQVLWHGRCFIVGIGGYYLGGLVGTVLSVPPSGFAILWPATAVLAAALICTPVRHWWIYLFALLPAHFSLIQNYQVRHIPLAVALTQIFGNFALASVTALVVRRASESPIRFDSLRAMSRFMLIAGIGVPAVVNSSIISVHLMTGWTHDFWLAWRQWMLASIFPTITVTPLLLLALREAALAGLRPSRIAEQAALCAALFLFGLTAFGGDIQSEYWPALLLTPLPLLLWAAVRLGVAGTCLSLLILAGAIIVRALHGVGPFAAGASVGSVVSLQVYLTVISVPLLLLSALMEEQRRTQEVIRRSEARIAVAAASTDTGLWQWDARTGDLWMTARCRTMFGLASETPETPDALLQLAHVEDRPRLQATLHAMLTSRETYSSGEFRLSDSERWVAFNTYAERNREGELVQVSGVFRDITERLRALSQVEQLGRRLLTLQEEERKNIAEELHDCTGQHLVAISLMMKSLRNNIPDDGGVGTTLDNIETSVAAALRELRSFTYLLRPPDLERQGLRAALQRYVDGFRRRTGIRATLRLLPVADGLPPEYQRTILRLVQESLANVYRHADATRVAINLRQGKDGRIHLMVRDDGQGMGVRSHEVETNAVGQGVGIPGMTARTQRLGGTILFRSSTRGTTVHVVLPNPAVAHSAGTLTFLPETVPIAAFRA